MIAFVRALWARINIKYICGVIEEILVSGGSGFSGSHCVYNLAASGLKLRVMSRQASPFKNAEKYLNIYPDWQEVISRNVVCVQGDVLNFSDVLDAVSGVSGIIHYAGMVGFDASKTDLLAANAGGTANMIDAALEAGVRKITMVGSIAALGRASAGEAVTEKTEWSRQKKTSGYGLSKMLAEREFWRGIAEGLEGVIVYPSVILGPGNPVLKKETLLKLLSKKRAYYPKGSGGFVDVRDVAEAVIRLHFSEVTGRGFILNGFNISFQDLLNLMAEVSGLSKPQRPVSATVLQILSGLKSIAPFALKGLPGREMIRILNSNSSYDSSRIISESSFEFRKAEETVKLAFA